MPSSDGISPYSLLLETSSMSRLISCPISGGIIPVRLFFDKSNPKESEEMLRISLGMDPSRLLTDRFNIINLWHCPRLAGMFPDNKLSSRESWFN